MATDRKYLTSHVICWTVVFSTVYLSLVNTLDISDCRTALGMQSGEIPDSAITASSSFDPVGVGPISARIRTETQGGAWCPKEQVTKDTHEYLQIDLGQLKVITLVETQGRFGNGQGQEYVEQYKLEYQREPEAGRWFKFRNRRNQEIFQGNINTHIPELRDVDPPIIARRIRFVPYSAHPKPVCLRVELYGCTWHDGTVSYAVPQGDRRSTETEFNDVTYDGEITSTPSGEVTATQLSGGLGQLTDGEEGQANFRVDPRGLGVKGYQWVGWRNDTFAGGPVEMIWKMDAVRNFSALRFHSNNMYSRDVRVFKSARVYFSVGGVHYVVPPVTYTYMRDSLMEYARTVVIPLQHNVGKFVKIQLYFDARWILISEVQFESEYVNEEVPAEQDPSNSELGGTVDIDTEHMSGTNKTAIPGGSLRVVPPGNTGGSDTDSANNVIHHDGGFTSHLNDETVGAIVGALATVTFLACVLVLFFTLQRRRRRRKYNSNGGCRSAGTVKCSADLMSRGGAATLASTGGELTSNGKVAVVNGNMYDVTATSDIESDITACCGGGGGGRKLGGAGTAIEFYHVPGGRLPDLPKTPDSSDTFTSRDYGLSTAPTTSLIINVPQPQSLSYLPPPPGSNTTGVASNPGYRSSGTLRRPCPPPPPPPQGHMIDPTSNNTVGGPPRSLRVDPVYSALGSGSVGVRGPAAGSTMGGRPPSATVTTASRSPSGFDVQDRQETNTSISEFPRENLRFVEKIGDGLFGEVHLCEAFHLSDCSPRNGIAISLPRTRSTVVVVKTLRRNANEQARDEFDRELRMSSRVCDINVVRLLGACLADEPRYIILEYPRHGDLTQYLRHHAPPTDPIDDIVNTSSRMMSSRRRRGGCGPVLSYGTLIYMASQVASGMKHLESLQLVHRDLAARNCLVGDLYEVKVADLGPGRDLYAADYCRTDGSASALPLPLRWMSWEAALQNRYSTKSDVWAFGVTLWEILTYARSRPLPSLSDADVISNLDRLRRIGADYDVTAGDSSVADIAVPDRPAGCPRETYDLMRECWRRDVDQRPTFREVTVFLQRLNVGYSPFDGPQDLLQTGPATSHVV